MPDAPTATASKSPIKDLPASKQEQRMSPSPDLPNEKDRNDGPPAAESATENTDPSAETTISGADRPNSQTGESIRPEATDPRIWTAEVPLFHNAMLLAARNVETVLTSSHVAMRTAEDVTQTAVEYGQRNYQQLSTMVRSLSEARSFADVLTLHRDHTRLLVEDTLEEATRLSHHLTKRFGEIIDTVVKQQPDLAAPIRQNAA